MSTSTSLVVASCKGHTEVVAALVEHKATDVNATVSGGWTALMWAAWWECPNVLLTFNNDHQFWYRYGHTKVVEVLLGAPKVEVDKTNQESFLVRKTWYLLNPEICL